MATPLTHHLLVSRLQDYWASLATPSLPMFVIAVLVIVACFITLLVRLVMGLSGNLCCKKGTGFFLQPREGGYHKGPILWLKIFLGVACGIAGIGAFLSFAYTGQLGDDLKAYTGVAVDVFNGVVDDVTRVDAVLSDAYYQLPEGARDDMSDVLDDIAELKDTVGELKSDVADYKDQMDSIFGYFTTARMAIATTTVGMMALTVLLSVFNKGRFLTVVVPFTLIFTFLAWILFGVLFLLATFVDDSCLAFSIYTDDRCECMSYTSALDELLPCPDATEVEGVIQDARKIITDLFDEANVSIDDANAAAAMAPTTAACDGMPTLTMPYSRCQFGCEGDTLDVYVDGQTDKETAMTEFRAAYEPFVCNDLGHPLLGEDAPSPACLDECKYLPAVGCDDGAVGCVTDYATLESQVSAAYSVIEMIPTVDDLLRCFFVADAFGQLVDGQCGGEGTSGSLEQMWRSFACLSVGSTIAAVVTIFGIKRFRGIYTDDKIDPNPMKAAGGGAPGTALPRPAQA